MQFGIQLRNTSTFSYNSNTLHHTPTPLNPQVDHLPIFSWDYLGPRHTLILPCPPPARWQACPRLAGDPDAGQRCSTFMLSLSLFHTYMDWVDFKFIEVVEDSLVFGVDVPVVAQSPEEPVLAVVGACHDALREVHHPLLEELIRCIQRTHELWREGAREFTQGPGSRQAGAGGPATAQPRPLVTSWEILLPQRAWPIGLLAASGGG